MSTDTSKPPQTILIIEDEAPMREVLAKRLEQEGYTVLTAENAIDGMSSALTHRPDLLLIDIQMQGMSGYEMLKRLRPSGIWGKHVRAIFLTNIVMTSDKESSGLEETEPIFYLVKSDTSLDELVQKVRSALSA